MDIIYTDTNRIDQGVLQDYSFDQEYGTSDADNTFQCKIQKYNSAISGTVTEKLEPDCIIYAERTEYGGIIDRIETNTKTGEITFTGRTWHGVLNSFVIEPESGKTYRTYSGDINEILAQIIDDLQISDLFTVDIDSENEISIENYTIRYEKGYDAIMKMLNSVSCKLICYYLDNKVHLRAATIVNYAINEEFDSSQVPFKGGYTYNNVNHLICLGKGDGADRAVIHLFTDEGGTIQPYTLVDNPLEDSEYILDKSQQIMTGLDEICEIYDAPTAEITTNYKPLESAPDSWKDTYFNYYERDEETAKYNQLSRTYKDEMWLTDAVYGGMPSNWYVSNGFTNYYYKDSDGNFKKISESDATETTAILLDTQPADWESEYNRSYYTRSGTDYTDYTYSIVQSAITEKYYKCPSTPEDWKTNYSNYYTRTYNGVKYVYNAVQPITKTKYDKQTKQPSDWTTNYGNYYFLIKKEKEVNGKTYKAGKYYSVSDGLTAKILQPKKNEKYPQWGKNKFYTSRIKTTVPKYEQGEIYYRVQTATAPAWQANTYYYLQHVLQWESGKYYEKHEKVEQIPDFVTGQYYYAVYDRYSALVESGIEKLNKLCDTSTLDIDLELTADYDIGDIIGASDTVSGIGINEPINKPIIRKIIEIKKDILSIRHEVD